VSRCRLLTFNKFNGNATTTDGSNITYQELVFTSQSLFFVAVVMMQSMNLFSTTTRHTWVLVSSFVASPALSLCRFRFADFSSSYAHIPLLHLLCTGR
jgi:hypothetical protein